MHIKFIIFRRKRTLPELIKIYYNATDQTLNISDEMIYFEKINLQGLLEL